MCYWIFEPTDNIIVHIGNISSRFSSNSETDASGLVENLKEIIKLKSSNTQ